MTDKARNKSTTGEDQAADIVLVCPNLGDGGTQRVVTTLANSWNRAGRKVCVITMYRKKNEVYQLDPGVRRIIIYETGDDNGSSRKTFRSWVRKKFANTSLIQYATLYNILEHVRVLRRAIKKSGAPVVVAFSHSTNIYAILACIGLKKKVIISERNDPARKVLERPWEMLRRKLYRYATLVTANSHGSLQALAAYVDQHKLAFVPNPLTPYRNHRNNYHDPLFKFPFILTVGRLHPQKAHDVLLKAFSYLPEHLKEWRLAFLGKGELKPTLQNEAQRLGIADRVEWYGQVQDPFPFYKAAKIFTLASRYEGMSNALMEAMSCGLPVIVSDACPGSLELVEHEKTGLVVPVDDPRALAEAITRLAEDPALRKRLGKAAQQRVADFEVSKALATWEQTIGLKAPDE